MVDGTLYVIGGSDKAGVKLQDIFRFKLTVLKPYSTTAVLQSEIQVAQDFLKLVDLAMEEHPASDLEIFV